MYATQQLREEHEGILVVLDVLEHLGREVALGRPVETADLARILDFLRTFADRCHHGKEEDLLFPALEVAGLPSQGGPIGVMLAEHTEGRAHIRGMADALARHPVGTAFADHALAYVRLLRAHIDKENGVLFMMTERMLPATVHAALIDAFAHVEVDKIGPGVHEQYHALIEELQARYLQQAA
jgi:hemerythrin-like domain-containing protein